VQLEYTTSCETPYNLASFMSYVFSGIIDYRCADGRFLMSPRGVAVSNHQYLSSSETRVNADIRGWKLHLFESN
jgi:hypothetical protein